ncbi:hypothetical protein FHS43_005239 [Streptosporangium becharense]|nr:hypothetical protein [Streptosporangium becharense]
MKKTPIRAVAAMLAMAGALTFGVAACGGENDDDGGGSSSSSSSE